MEAERKPRIKLVREMEDCYFRAEEVAKYLSMGLSTIWVKGKDINDSFPSPRKISERISVFKKSELDDWVNRNTETVIVHHTGKDEE